LILSASSDTIENTGFFKNFIIELFSNSGEYFI